MTKPGEVLESNANAIHYHMRIESGRVIILRANPDILMMMVPYFAGSCGLTSLIQA